MPRLTEFDWRVDLKMASGKIARMSEPTCILHLKVSFYTVHSEKFVSFYHHFVLNMLFGWNL